MKKSTKIFDSFIIIVFVLMMIASIFYESAETGSTPYFMAFMVLSAVYMLVWYIWHKKPFISKDRVDGSGQRLTRPRWFRKGEIVDAVLDCIRAGLSLHGNGIAVIGSKEDAQMVRWMIESGYVPEDEITRAVHDGICLVGREMFEWCCANPLGNRPDHALSTEALGYAIKHGAISSEEVALLKFDHGEKPEEYIQSAEGLLEKVVLQLQNGTAFFDLSNLGGSDDFCCDCSH